MICYIVFCVAMVREEEKMGGKWAVFRCVDGRLNVPLEIFLKNLGVPPDYYPFTLIGGMRQSHQVISDLDFAVGRLGIRHAIFVQHTDCKAYGGRIMCGNTEKADKEFQTRELRRIIDDVRRCERLVSRFVLAHIDNNGQVFFEEID